MTDDLGLDPIAGMKSVPLRRLVFSNPGVAKVQKTVLCCSRHSQLSHEQITMPPMHEHSYFTYIMASRSHTLHIGVTSDLHKRVFQHKWKEHEGFTAKYNCDRLVWFEGRGEIAAGIRREKELKG